MCFLLMCTRSWPQSTNVGHITYSKFRLVDTVLYGNHNVFEQSCL
jgi:hypothetical protein